MITRLYAMNLVGDVDILNRRNTKFQPPKMMAALDSVLCQKTKEQHICHFKITWETNLFEEEEDENYALNILVSESRMTVVPSALFGLLLNSQWAITPADNLPQENGIVDLFFFAPQNANIKGVDNLKRGEQHLDNELFLFESDTHKMKKRMNINRVGIIASVRDVIKACTNWITMELMC